MNVVKNFILLFLSGIAVGLILFITVATLLIVGVIYVPLVLFGWVLVTPNQD